MKTTNQTNSPRNRDEYASAESLFDIDSLNRSLTQLPLSQAMTRYCQLIKDDRANGQTHRSIFNALAYTTERFRASDYLKLLYQAQNNQADTPKVYKGMLTALQKNQYYDNKLILSLFDASQKAQAQGFQKKHYFDTHLHDIALDLLAKSSKPALRDVEQIFSLADKVNALTPRTFNGIINAIANSEHPDLRWGMALLAQAEALGLVDIKLYTCSLKLIYKCHSPDLNTALAIFNKAKELRCCNDIHVEKLYNAIITVLARVKTKEASELAVKLFDESRRLGIVSPYIYTSLLTALKPDDVHFAKDFFESAKEECQPRKTIDHHGIYQKMIDVLAQHTRDYTKEGNYLLSEAVRLKLLALPQIINGEMDLHGLSYGEAYFFLRDILPRLHQNADLNQIVLIQGLGTHARSKNEHNQHALQQAVLDVIASFSHTKCFEQRLYNGNPGKTIIKFHDKKRHVATHFAPINPIKTTTVPANSTGSWAELVRSSSNIKAPASTEEPDSAEIPSSNLNAPIRGPKIPVAPGPLPAKPSKANNPMPASGKSATVIIQSSNVVPGPNSCWAGLLLKSNRKDTTTPVVPAAGRCWTSMFRPNPNAPTQPVESNRPAATQPDNPVTITTVSTLNPEAKPYTPSYLSGRAGMK